MIKSLKKKYPYIDLFKTGILLNALLTAWVGFYLSSHQLGNVDFRLFLYLLIGLTPLFAGSAALNHFFEIDVDSKMDRTKNRPLPSNRIQPKNALVVSLVLIVSGGVIIYLTMPWPCFIASVLVVVCYNFIYTPMKRLTWLNTYFGAIPGALPPLCGWLAVQPLTQDAMIIFFVFYFWQLPHFFSIAWQYKDAYTNSGLRMISRNDDYGYRTRFHTIATTGMLIIATLVPYFYHFFGDVYVWGIVVINSAFLWSVLKFFREPSQSRAKFVMFASIIYQPILILFMFLDKAL